MKKMFLFFIAMFMFFGIVACKKASDQVIITIEQNKPEISDQLNAFAKKFTNAKNIKVNVKSCGGSCQLDEQLKADFAAGEEPDIFVIDGISAYNEWKDHIAPLDNEPWVKDTDYAFTINNTVYGFPVSIEGYGLAYNKDLLDQAGVDPTTLTNYSAYLVAFQKINGMKSTLGINSVVSMAAGTSVDWTMRDHDLNAYLSNGLTYGDQTIVDQALNGQLDTTRFQQYADWVKLLFDYSDPNVLTTGTYDDQVNAFINKKAVFLHQGNWIEPNLKSAGATFNRGFTPYGSLTTDTDGIFVAAPSWYVVNKDSKHINEAKQFLTYMATTDVGADYMVNQIGAVPAFKSITLKPQAPLSKAIMEWSNAGKIYSWNQYKLPESFRSTLGPIYGQLAAGTIDETQFISMMTDQFKKVSTYK